MHGARLHKTSQRDAMARDPRRDLLGRARDIAPRPRKDRDVEDFVRDETLVRFETVSRPRRIDRDHIPGLYISLPPSAVAARDIEL